MVLEKLGVGCGQDSFGCFSQICGATTGFRHSNKSRKLFLKLRKSVSIHVE